VSELHHFDAEHIARADPRRVFDVVEAAFAMVSDGRAIAPIRAHVVLGDGSDSYLISGALPDFDVFTVKVINVVAANPARGLERLQGALTAFELSTGRPLATLEARAATQARTAAGSAVSTRRLARPDSDVLTIFGTGPQAVAHLRAMTAEWEFREIRIVGRSPAAAVRLASEWPGSRAVDAADALPGASVVVTATNSTTPLFAAADVEPGTHVVLVGSGSAAAVEVDPELLGRAAGIFADHRPTVLQEAGEVVEALRRDIIKPKDVHEIGELVLGRVDGRRSDDDITVYESVGNGTQDAALAALLLGRVAEP
jgi:ornithine cyclodeaminase